MVCNRTQLADLPLDMQGSCDAAGVVQHLATTLQPTIGLDLWGQISAAMLRTVDDSLLVVINSLLRIARQAILQVLHTIRGFPVLCGSGQAGSVFPVNLSFGAAANSPATTTVLDMPGCHQLSGNFWLSRLARHKMQSHSGRGSVLGSQTA